MENSELTKKSRGGARVGAGRKRKCVKRVSFDATQEVLDVLSTVEGNRNDFIRECILAHAKRE